MKSSPMNRSCTNRWPKLIPTSPGTLCATEHTSTTTGSAPHTLKRQLPRAAEAPESGPHLVRRCGNFPAPPGLEPIPGDHAQAPSAVCFRTAAPRSFPLAVATRLNVAGRRHLRQEAPRSSRLASASVRRRAGKLRRSLRAGGGERARFWPVKLPGLPSPRRV